MTRLFDLKIFDNTIGNYVLITGIILLAVSLKRFFSRHLAGLVFRGVKKVVTGVDKKSFVDLVISPLEIFLVITVTLVSLDKLHFPTALNFTIYKISLHRILEIIASVTMIILLLWLLLRIIDFIAIILERKGSRSENASDKQLIIFFKDFFKVILIIFGVLLVLKFAFNFKISSLITGLSLAGAAVALATRESIENLIASFIIFFDRPFSTGDLVKIQNITGTVERIGLRSTRIRTTQKTYVTVPNKQMVDTVMDNLSLQTQRRAFVSLELGDDVSREVLDQFVWGVRQIILSRKDRVENFTVFVSDIVKNSIVVTIEYFTATIPVADFNELRQYVNLEVIGLMKEMNIRLAGKPARTEEGV